MLLPGQDVWRIFGTGILTAVACAILLPLSFLSDKTKTRWAGLTGMGVVVLEYLLGVLLIWGLDNHLGGVLEEELAFASLFVPMLGLPLAFLVQMAGTQLGRWAGRIGIGLCVIEFGLAMAAVTSDALRIWQDQLPALAGMGRSSFRL